MDLATSCSVGIPAREWLHGTRDGFRPHGPGSQPMILICKMKYPLQLLSQSRYEDIRETLTIIEAKLAARGLQDLSRAGLWVLRPEGDWYFGAVYSGTAYGLMPLLLESVALEAQ